MEGECTIRTNRVRAAGLELRCWPRTRDAHVRTLPDLGGPPLGQASFGSRAAAGRLHEYRTARGGTHIGGVSSESFEQLQCVRRTHCNCTRLLPRWRKCQTVSLAGTAEARRERMKHTIGARMPKASRMPQESAPAALWRERARAGQRAFISRVAGIALRPANSCVSTA